MRTSEMVREFHELFVCPINEENTRVLRLNRRTLVHEEYMEFIEAMFGGDLEEIAKELADLLYVIHGTALALGIDLDEAVEIVHRSNMSKFGPGVKPMMRSDGKILKPDTYVPPDMSPCTP